MSTRIKSRGDVTWEGDTHRVVKVENPCEPESNSVPEKISLPEKDKTQLVDDRESNVPPFEEWDFDWCPGLEVVMNDAAEQFGTAKLVILILYESKPAVAIENELWEDSFPAMYVISPGGHPVFVTSTESAKHLLRTHCGVGGRFVADRMDSRSNLHEYWTMIVDTNEVKACSYHCDRTTSFATSDFNGLQPVAEEITEDELASTSGSDGDKE